MSNRYNYALKKVAVARHIPQTYFFGAGASAILSNHLMGWVAGSLRESDSHTKSGEQTGLLERSAIAKKGEPLGTRLFPCCMSHALFK